MSDDYRRRMAELEAEKDFNEKERKRREQEKLETERKRQEEERIRQEVIATERRYRAEYERLKRLGMILPPYEEWKRRLI